MANNLVDNTNYGFKEGVPYAAKGYGTVDLNTLTETGFYWCYRVTNGPSRTSGTPATAWIIIVVKYGTEIDQLAISMGGNVSPSGQSSGLEMYGRNSLETSDSSYYWYGWQKLNGA